MKVLVTGGAGYIGSHTTLALLAAGHEVRVVDNLCNSSRASLARVAELAGRACAFEEADVRDAAALRRVFAAGKPDAVIHFAGLKAVGESVREPLAYWDNNVTGTQRLLEAMDTSGVRTLVFSSSATVYGEASQPPFREDSPLAPTNPYGSTKLAIERLLADVAAGGGWHVALLRYFNPVGGHESGRIGEDPRGIPNNLMPRLCQAASGRGEALSIFGDDYPTADGTAIRDYIHVMDLAEGHLAALAAAGRLAGATAINLGSGQGHSVRELVAAFERVNGVRVPHRVAPRRQGDITSCYADPGLARRLLGWQTRRTLEDMCRDAWRWQSANPDGYPGP